MKHFAAFVVAMNLVSWGAQASFANANPELGTMGEYSLKSENLGDSIQYWTALGFSVLAQEKEPYPYAILSDGQTTLGLHQDPNFKGPLLTYYAADMSERIAKLQANGVPFVKILKDPSGHVFAGILRSPESQLIFLVEWKTFRR